MEQFLLELNELLRDFSGVFLAEWCCVADRRPCGLSNLNPSSQEEAATLES